MSLCHVTVAPTHDHKARVAVVARGGAMDLWQCSLPIAGSMLVFVSYVEMAMIDGWQLVGSPVYDTVTLTTSCWLQNPKRGATPPSL